MLRVAKKAPQTKKSGVVIPIRVPLEGEAKDIEIPIRLILAISFYRVKHISEQSETDSGEVLPTLTQRQNETLGGILKNQSNKEIADVMNLSERTVKYHVSCLFAAFKVKTRAELRTAVCGKVTVR